MPAARGMARGALDRRAVSRPGRAGMFCGAAGRRGSWKRRAVGALLMVCAFVLPAPALDTDIFTGTQVNPNIFILFDNSGSMGSQAYNTYPDTIYSGTYSQGVVYSRCANASGKTGGNVNSNCTCKSTQTSWV